MEKKSRLKSNQIFICNQQSATCFGYILYEHHQDECRTVSRIKTIIRCKKNMTDETFWCIIAVKSNSVIHGKMWIFHDFTSRASPLLYYVNYFNSRFFTIHTILQNPGTSTFSRVLLLLTQLCYDARRLPVRHILIASYQSFSPT